MQNIGGFFAGLAGAKNESLKLPEEKKEEIMDELFLEGVNEKYVWQVNIPS